MKKFLVILVCFLAALFLSIDKRVFSKNSLNGVFRVDVAGLNDKTSFKVLSEDTDVVVPTWCKDCVTSLGSFSKIKQSATWSVQSMKNNQMTIRLMGPDVRLDNKRVPVYVIYKNLVVDGNMVSKDPIVVFHDKPYKYVMDVKAGQKIQFSVVPEKAGVLDYWQTLHVKWLNLILYFACFVGAFVIVKKLLKKKSKSKNDN